jgi:hypothetical protein
MRSLENDGIDAREHLEQRVRKLEEDLDACVARVLALEADLEQAALWRQSEDLEAERREAIAAGKHGRVSADERDEEQPPISDAADESSEDSQGQVEPSFDSSEVTRLEVVARDLLRAHGWRANMDFLWAHTRWSRLARAVVAAHRRASRDLVAVRRVSWYRIANRLVLREANDRGILWSNVRAGSGTAIAHVKSGGTLTEYHWMMMRKSACQRTRQFACQFSVPGGA